MSKIFSNDKLLSILYTVKNLLLTFSMIYFEPNNRQDPQPELLEQHFKLALDKSFSVKEIGDAVSLQSREIYTVLENDVRAFYPKSEIDDFLQTLRFCIGELHSNAYLYGVLGLSSSEASRFKLDPDSEELKATILEKLHQSREGFCHTSTTKDKVAIKIFDGTRYPEFKSVWDNALLGNPVAESEPFGKGIMAVAQFVDQVKQEPETGAVEYVFCVK